MSIARRRRALTAAVRRSPAPALLAVSILGWAGMAWLTAMSAAQAAGAHVGPAMGAHSMHATDAASSAPHGLLVWIAMVAAMSPLLLMREVARLRHGSLRRRRGLTILAFATGYGLVWLLVGAVAANIASVLGASAWIGGLAVVLVIVWQCSPLRQRLVNVCHRVPRLRVFGPDATWDAGRYGVVTGASCAASCGPIMVLVLLAADFHLLAMIGATVLLTAERYQPARRPRWRLPFVATTPEHVALAPYRHAS
jgi:hypothetical protein